MCRCRIESLGTSLPGWSLLPRGSVKHAVLAGRRCLAASHYRPADVQVLINAGVYRDGHVAEPAGAVYLQHRLGINVEFQGRETLSFDLVNGGCGMLNALHVLDAMLRNGQCEVGMVIAGESNPDRRPDPDSRVIGSGAALLLDLSPTGETGFGSFAFHTDDAAADLFQAVVSLAVPRGRLFIKRREGLEDAYLAAAGAAVEECLAKEKITRDDVALVVPSQVSPAFLVRLPGAIGVSADRVADLTGVLPDTGSTSPILAWQKMTAQRPPVAGEYRMMLAVGSGVTAGAALYRA